jgi:DNA processing protein
MTELTDLVALSLIPWHRWRDVAEALRAGRSAAAALDSFIRNPAERSTLRDRALAAQREAGRRAIAPIPWTNVRYPSALGTIIDPPFVLWTRGDLAALDRPAVALVGSRAASAHALAVAERLGADLASRGVTVVSGLARGVDSAAHRGALSAGGRTVGVLGSGADVVYPREHTGLARDMERDGAVISELVPGTPPLPPFFPLRNRIISGLCRAVVVIEAGEKSGSLITARFALEQGRDVLAVPGNVLSGRNRGAHALLRDGAKIVESADDILEELGCAPERGTGKRTATPFSDPVLECLTPGEPADLDAIAGRSGLSAARLLSRLLELELQGVVTRAGGGRFVRVDRTC